MEIAIIESDKKNNSTLNLKEFYMVYLVQTKFVLIKLLIIYFNSIYVSNEYIKFNNDFILGSQILNLKMLYQI